MRFFNYLIILATIIFIQDFKFINSIFVKILHNNVNYNNIPIDVRYNNSEIIINQNNFEKKCKIINKYGNLNIITYNNLVYSQRHIGFSKKFLLKCIKTPYVTIIKCNKYLKNCIYYLTPSLSYRCFPSKSCNFDLFNKINSILYIK